MDVDAYLRRIGLSEGPPATLEGLTQLHRAHLRSVPYENLDVQLGRRLTIERAPMFEKIVGRRRGGWCYEMNGILGWALGELGFAARRATGAVVGGAGRDAMVGNHLVIRVELPEGLYLADVGVSNGPLDPIPIREGGFASGGFDYRVERLDDDWWRFHNHSLAKPLAFDFNLDPADEGVFAQRCVELQTEAWSPFLQNLICTRFTDGGTQILLGRTLRHVTPAGREERLLESEGELMAALGDLFGLDVPEAASLWPRICERHEQVAAARAAEAAAS